MDLRLDETLTRLRTFRTEQVPAFRAYQRQRDELLAGERERLRLDEYQPAVMNTFVRNRLLNEVYLPLIGDNLAKQLNDGTGLLLLISPPGYGKTTLMEYVANRLGLVFVKVNGPALGTRRHLARPGRRPRTPPHARRSSGSTSRSSWAATFCCTSTTSSTPRRSCCRSSSRCATRNGASTACGTARHARSTCGASASRCRWPATRTPRPAARSASRTCSPTARTCGTSATCCPAARTCSR